MPEDTERVREILGDRAARAYARRFDPAQLHWSDIRRRAGEDDR